MNEQAHSQLQCCAIVGAGELMSKIWRIQSDAGLPEYRYTIELVDAVPGIGTPLFEPADLVSLVNLLRVLTRELLHDGGFSAGDKVWLKQFALRMDDVCDVLRASEYLPNNGQGLPKKCPKQMIP